MVNWNIINKESRRNILTFLTIYHPCMIIESVKDIKNKYKIHVLNEQTLSFHVDGSSITNNF